MRMLLEKKGTLIFIFILVFLSSGYFLLAEDGPKVKFKEKSWGFGKVKQGKVLKHVFVFKNEGTKTLVVKKVWTSCGCAAALISEKNIPPGESGEIKATFDTRGYEGENYKYIYMESNDSSQPVTQLTLTAEIDVPPMPKIDVDRYSYDLGIFLEKQDVLARTKIRNKGELELRVNFTHRNAIFFTNGKKTSFPLRVPSGKEVEVEIKISPPKRKGIFREYILVKSNDVTRPTLSLYMTGYVVTKKQLKELIVKYKEILD